MGACVNKSKKENIVKKSAKEAKTNTKESNQSNLFDYRKKLDMNKINPQSAQLSEKKEIVSISPMTTSNKNENAMQNSSILMKSKQIETNRDPIKEEPSLKNVDITKTIKEQNTNKQENTVLNKAKKAEKTILEENTIENLIEDRSTVEEELFKLKNVNYEPLYNFADFCMISNFEYSTENDWNQLIKKAKYHNKSLLAIKLLNLNERKWNKENILLSDIIKENRENMDSYLIAKYLNLRLKLQEHFNWIIWAISYYYYSLLLTEINSTKSNYFTQEDFGLPPVDHIDWLNGFEWKGIYIRVMPEFQAKYMQEEMKALNYLFFEYIQLIDSYKVNVTENTNKNLLSNELIFPLISYAKVCSLVIVGSVTINKYSYDMSEHYDGDVVNAENNNYNEEKLNNVNIFTSNPDFKIREYLRNNQNNPNLNPNNSTFRKKESKKEKNPLLVSNKDIKVYASMQINNKKNGNGTINGTINGMTHIDHNYDLNKDTLINYDISNIVNNNNSIYSINVSHNINKDINLKLFSREDISQSILLSKIEAHHLIKVIDDLNDCNNYGNNQNMTQYGTFNANGNEINNPSTVPKFKFMIISATDLIPNLVYKNSKKKAFLFSEEDERKPFIFFTNDNIPNKLNEKINSLNNNSKPEGSNSKLFSPSNFEKVIYKDLCFNEFYESTCMNTSFKIFYDKKPEKKEKNCRINEYFLNIFSKQINFGLSINKLLNTFSFAKHKYLKALLIDNKKLEISGKSVILFSVSNNVKLKYSLIKSYKNKKSENIYTESFTDYINYPAYFDRFTKILDMNLSITNVQSLKDFLHRYGINTSLEIFLLPKLKNQKISDLIKADILCKILKHLLNFHEGLNFLVKLNLINVNNCSSSLKNLNENIETLHDGFFDFINAKSIKMIQKEKIFHMISAILNPTKTKEKFLKFFYDNLNYIFLFKKLKWKYMDEYIGFNLFNEVNEEGGLNVSNVANNQTKGKRLNLESLLSDLIANARQKPFLFLNALEHHLNILIEPAIKFRASLAIEQFNNSFTASNIMDTDPSVDSYIKCEDLSYYLMTKCIYTSKTSTKYDHFLNKVTNHQNTSETNSIHPSSKSKDKNLNNGVNNINNVKGLNHVNSHSNFFRDANDNKLLPKKLKEETNFRTNNNINNMNNIANVNNPHYNPDIFLSNKQTIFPSNLPKSKPVLFNNNNIVSEQKIYKLVDDNKKGQNSAIGKINSNIKINSNNITKINMINNRYVDSSSKVNEKLTNVPSLEKNKFDNDVTSSYRTNNINSEKNFLNRKEEEEIMMQKAKIWDNLSLEMDMQFPPILYKLLFKYDEKHNTKVVNKYLRSNYSFNKIDTIKNWKSSLEMLLNDIITVNGSELVIIQAYILLFVHGYFVENDYSLCKEILFKVKENLKNLISYNLELMAIINLIEGLIVEKKNYIESEEYYSKCLIFSLFLHGDPRGRGNFGNNFMLFPLWKIARQTCILENPLTNENFKEMFHCQDFSFKLSMDYSGNGSVSGVTATPNVHYNNLYDENLNYAMRKDIFKKNKRNRSYFKKLETNQTTRKNLETSIVNISEIEFDQNISENESIEEESSDKNFQISSKLFNYSNTFKYFPFPSTSDVKTSYNTYFTSENFILFILKNIYKIDNSRYKYDEDVLNKIGLNCYSIMNSIELTNKELIKNGSSYKSSFKKDKSSIFSVYMYDFLLDKLSYKKNHPDNILLAWGNNSHNETTHNNYDFLSLPRICYKLKNHQVIKISSGWEHNIVMTTDKKCFTWGNNEAGQCGVPETPVIYHPKLIEIQDKIYDLTLGNEHSLALMETGDVYSWGKSEDGVLGYVEREIEFIPKKINSIKNIVGISAGSIHNLVVDREGCVYSWGCSKGGQLGHSENFLINIKNFTGYLINPSPIVTLKNTKIKKVSCGEAHSLALTYDGKVYGWGFTSNGQLGIGICEDSFEPGQGMSRCRILEPRLIETESSRIIDIQCGKTFSTFITEKHELLVCGINDLNQLGIEQPESTDHLYSKSDVMYNRCCDVVYPTPIEYFLNMKVKKVVCGESHCLGLIEDLSNKHTTLWSWGSNRFGQLGQGNQIKKSMPKPINYILGYTNSEVVEISCGGFHSMCTISNNFSSKEEETKETMQIQALNRFYSSKWVVE